VGPKTQYSFTIYRRWPQIPAAIRERQPDIELLEDTPECLSESSQSRELYTSRHDPASDSAFVEISPKSIDELAAESVTRTKFRRSEVQSKGFALHFSTPRASLKPGEQDRRYESRSDVREPSKLIKKQDWTSPKRETWQIQKAALKEKIPEAWNPLKRLSPDALVGIRAIHAQFPAQYTTSVLAAKFEVSPEVIRRILRAKWKPNEEEEIDRQRRWFTRGIKVWSRYAELGVKPPAKWRKLGVGKKDNPGGLGIPVVQTTARQSYSEGVHDEAEADSLAERIL
jgi:hypothetical protein